jgi:hypothetical protein
MPISSYLGTNISGRGYNTIIVAIWAVYLASTICPTMAWSDTHHHTTFPRLSGRTPRPRRIRPLTVRTCSQPPRYPIAAWKVNIPTDHISKYRYRLYGLHQLAPASLAPSTGVLSDVK